MTILRQSLRSFMARQSKDKVDAQPVKALEAEDLGQVSDAPQVASNDSLAKLSGGVAVVKVGAPTEFELKERKSRVEDAISATKAAIEEGVVPGGGVAYIRAVSALDALELPDDEAVGKTILKKALEMPIRIIARISRQKAEDLGPLNDTPQVASLDSSEVLEPSTQSPVQDDTIDSTEGDGDSNEKPTPEDQGPTEDSSPTSLQDILANQLPAVVSVDNMISDTLGNIFQKKVTKDTNLQALLDGHDDVDLRDLATELKEFADEIGATRKPD